MIRNYLITQTGGKNMRLLLAEDEKELANALAAVLKHNNYSIDVGLQRGGCL